MRVISDANIALRLVAPNEEQERIKAAVRSLVAGGHDVFYTPQVMREVYATCTRPAASNGLGLGVEDARKVLSAIESSPLRLLNDVPAVYESWRELIETVEIRGAQTMLLRSRSMA